MFEVTGKNPLLDIAIELERIALQDDYFVTRKLYPNVDFYSGLIYQAMGFPVTMFPVLFAIPADVGVDCAVGRDAARPGAEDRAAEADLHRSEAARLRAGGQATIAHDARCDARARVRRRDGAVGCDGAGVVLLACSAEMVDQSASPERSALKFDSGRAYEDLRRQVGFGPRPAGSAALAQCRQYILAS